MSQRYLRPGWVTTNVLNRAVAGLARLGIGVWGACILTVRGRRSGRPRSTPVNVLTHRGARYLVSPRGTTEWVRNLRAAGEGELRSGRSVQRFTATELSDAEKPEVLRAYLRRWRWELGAFFEGVGADASDEELLRIAPNHPVFRID